MYGIQEILWYFSLWRCDPTLSCFLSGNPVFGDDYNKPVCASIYLHQIQAGEYLQTKKMVLLK